MNRNDRKQDQGDTGMTDDETIREELGETSQEDTLTDESY